ncbi:hypothetical protein [Brevundimonas bullata]
MKTVLLASVLLSAAPMAAHSQSGGQSPSAEELTRLLNGGPPAAARPAAATPTPTPVPTTAAPVRPTVAPTPRPSPVQAAPAPGRVTPTPTPGATPTPAPTSVAPARAPVAATPIVPARTPAPAPSAAAAPAPASAASAAPGALSPAAIAALPFRIELPTGFQLFEGRSAPDSHVYSVRRAGKTFAMIYAGPSSQFPIYDGEQVTAAGRVSVVVPEGTRRIAMEHLFQRSTAPAEIHVWLMSLTGADRDVAERIAQSVDPK